MYAKSVCILQLIFSIFQGFIRTQVKWVYHLLVKKVHSKASRQTWLCQKNHGLQFKSCKDLSILPRCNKGDIPCIKGSIVGWNLLLEKSSTWRCELLTYDRAKFMHFPSDIAWASRNGAAGARAFLLLWDPAASLTKEWHQLKISWYVVEAVAHKIQLSFNSRCSQTPSSSLECTSLLPQYTDLLLALLFPLVPSPGCLSQSGAPIARKEQLRLRRKHFINMTKRRVDNYVQEFAMNDSGTQSHPEITGNINGNGKERWITRHPDSVLFHVIYRSDTFKAQLTHNAKNEGAWSSLPACGTAQPRIFAAGSIFRIRIGPEAHRANSWAFWQKYWKHHVIRCVYIWHAFTLYSLHTSKLWSRCKYASNVCILHM